jgi:hypothetical protein
MQVLTNKTLDLINHMRETAKQNQFFNDDAKNLFEQLKKFNWSVMDLVLRSYLRRCLYRKQL